MSGIISFILDDKTVQIDFNSNAYYAPTTTVLNYLRSLPDHKGVKEGCAEGDCGACTVALGEMGKEGKIRYRAVDSCLIFLPMIHGKQLITVENLTGPDGQLHPVQQAMVDYHGAQCGFCTPGIVMSMFALYKNHNHPSREIVEDALTGNLCRCTGYRPIIDAALKACSGNGSDHFTTLESKTAEMLNSIPMPALKIQTDRQLYFKPVTLSEALLLKAEHPDALLISGASDMALKVTKKHEVPDKIIDLSSIPGLKEISDNDDGVILGAGLPLNEIMPVVQKSFPALFDMLKVYGSSQIRNVATIGGSLGTASPIGDIMPLMMAYGGKVVLESVHGKRKVTIDSFVTGYRQTVRTPEEIITSVKIKKAHNDSKVRSYKVSKRKDLDISTVSAGFRVACDSSGIVKEIVLAYGGMAEVTKRAKATETFLTGKQWTRTNIEGAMNILDTEFKPISDARSGAEFRQIAARNLLLKFWDETK
jgi:xanthine dehydrogenase small subunit